MSSSFKLGLKSMEMMQGSHIGRVIMLLKEGKTSTMKLMAINAVRMQTKEVAELMKMEASLK